MVGLEVANMSPNEYRNLIQAFVDEAIPAKEFEARYLAAFKSEPGGMSPQLYSVLEKLFEDVDAYWEDCPPGQETAFIISEQRLRQEAKKALELLNHFLASTLPTSFA